MFSLVVRFDLKDDAGAKFDSLVRELLPLVHAEVGTLEYSVYRVMDAPLARVFVEKYESRAAFDAHERYSHTKTFLAERKPLIESLRVEFLGGFDELAG